MRSRRFSLGLVMCAALLFGAAACSSSSNSSLDTLTSASPSSVESTTSVAGPTTTAAATTTTVAPTTTVVAATTTTVPVGASVGLRGDGVGDAIFGADPDGVIDYLNALFGAPSSDSGWVSAVERTCPGTEVRSVSWGDLALLFGDESSVSSGRRHFFAWSYGPAPSGVAISPAGLATAPPGLIGIGSTVAQIRAAYPTASISPGDELVGPSAAIGDGLVAFLTNTSRTGVVTSLVGGFGCGE
ncbi:unannotated protein [freshwater metagenome]|uniref:Unannotated protein n=1 Tax=freshwater metagenome TaxID=449393 RepID=A0A6J7DRM2_9ZZZZ|nr:hypothetical protein [Actinomycetota bacterium]